MMAPVLEAENIVRHFPAGTSTVHAVNGVSLSLNAGEVLAVVGESGCGKSTLGRILVALDRPTKGAVRMNGNDLSALTGTALRKSRAGFQMIFQDPGTSLNPRWTIGQSLREPLENFAIGTRADRAGRVRDLLARVGLRPEFAERYPHELSGGQKQRVAIARALAGNPRLLVADEPVSALDVSVRAQVINLLSDLIASGELALVFISHDIGVVAHISTRIAVMYLGRIVEMGPTAEVLRNPQHPYTRGLLDAVPVPDPEQRRTRTPLTGDPPSPIDLPPGCAFVARCPHAIDSCRNAIPELRAVSPARSVACLRSEEISTDEL